MSKPTRKELLLAKLTARTDNRGRAKPGYSQNVAAIKAELATYEENSRGVVDSGDE